MLIKRAQLDADAVSGVVADRPAGGRTRAEACLLHSTAAVQIQVGRQRQARLAGDVISRIGQRRANAQPDRRSEREREHDSLSHAFLLVMGGCPGRRSAPRQAGRGRSRKCVAGVASRSKD